MFLTAHRVLTSRLNILSCGFPKIAPPLTFTLRVLSSPLPKEVSSVYCCQAPDTFRPCRSSRLRRFTPRTALQACCILQPVMGFELFPVGPPFHCVATSVGSPSLSQARSSHPSKLFPLWKPHRVTAAVAIMPLRFLIVSGVNPLCFMALLLHRVRCHSSPFPLTTDPLLPWALFPFKALPSFRLPIWTAPEFFRRSGFTLDHDHRSVRVLDVACTDVLAWPAKASPSQLPAPRGVPSATALPEGSAAGLPTEVSLPLSCPSQPLLSFVCFRANSVGILPSCFMNFRDHLGSRWLWFHVSRVLGHMA